MQTTTDVPFGEEPDDGQRRAVASVGERYAPIPAGLDTMEPGPVLAGWLSSIDVAAVSPYDRVVVLRAHDRLVSHFQAQRYRDMAAVAAAEADLWGPDVPGHVTDEAAAAEVRVALGMTRRAADAEMEMALALSRRLPVLSRMLMVGDIDVARARVIERGTMHLPDEAARSILDELGEEAGRLTTGQLRSRLRRMCIEVDPADAQERYDAAVERRRVVAEATDESTANLIGLDLPPDRVAAIRERIDRIARGLRGGDETRSMDQLRADVYLDLLDGVDHGDAPPGVVDITVDLETLAGLSDHPGELAGYGPVIADVARRVTRERVHATWRVTVTDPADGSTVASGVTGRRPTASLRRRVETRDGTCVFPGCRMPARRSDIDHIEAVADGGVTSEENLAPLCRRDHCIKHAFGWTYRRLPDGRYRWTSPFGHTYTTGRSPP